MNPQGFVIADALPYIDQVVVDRTVAEAALSTHESRIRADLGGDIVDLFVGPGFGRAWVGTSGERYAVVDIDDFGLVVVVGTTEDCAGGRPDFVDGVPVFYMTMPSQP